MLSDFGILEALPAGNHSLNTIIGEQISFFALIKKQRLAVQN